jgi:predicted nuclease of predicted toxin-antitoxin system
MRILADENLPAELVRALREAGHSTAWIREDAPGSTDVDVLARSVKEDRILLTFDRDFGALVFQHGENGSRGIVLLRIVMPPDELARFVSRTLDSRSDWAGHFSVVDLRQIRMRRLPSKVP